MKRILLHHNNKRYSLKVKERLLMLFRERGIQLTRKNPDLIVVIGGDGTMLSAIRRYRSMGLPFIGVDTGSLGFLPSIMTDHLEELMDILENGNYRVVSYPLLKVKSKTVRGKIIEDFAFNEIVIKHLEPKLMEVKMFINDKAFNYFTGDGFIVSTPIGATGYAIWAGGAVMHSDLDVFQITPIHPNDNSINRPLESSLIVPQDTTLDFKIVKANTREVIVACDGNKMSNDFIREVHICSCEEKIKVLRSDHYDYFDLYKRKIIDKNVRRYLR